ncbi:MAG: glycosyltransferase [Beijerinckiaceae bacterium]
MTRSVLCLMHPMDPRGAKLGGIETHVRHIIAFHPADFDLLFVGVDEAGDMTLGQPEKIEVMGRTITFLPVARESADTINRAATKLLRSITLRTVAGALRHAATIKKLIAGRPASCELQRFEFAAVARLLGLRTVQIVHGEGTKKDKMDSLIKRFWFIHSSAERLALRLAARIACVNPNIVERMKREFPHAVPKAEVMTVSVDTKRFAAQAFDTRDGIFRIVFAGRLDEFKDPPLMFETFRRLHEKLHGRFEFHYVGMTDPSRYAEFAAIEAFTIRHGFQDSAGVARIGTRCHAGVLTSFFEGMPCYLLETLALGRPFAAIRLPQYDPLVVKGVSGTLIERAQTPDESAEILSDAFAALWQDIREGRIDPRAVHDKVLPYAVDRQMARLFQHHRALMGTGAPPAARSDAAQPQAA